MAQSHEHTSHGHDDHSHGHDDVGYHATVGGYAVGFVLSVILTAIPFWLVMNKVIASPALTAVVILGFAAVQVVVHVVYFLHLDAKSENGWNMLATIFTVVLLFILIAGSVWVMHNMNANMMPHPAHGTATHEGMSMDMGNMDMSKMEGMDHSAMPHDMHHDGMQHGTAPVEAAK